MRLLLIVLLFASLWPGLGASAIVGPSDEHAESLLSAARAAVGGDAALSAVDSLTASGELYSPGAQGGAIVIDLLPPARFKSVQRLLFPMLGSADVLQVLDGTTARVESKKKATLPGTSIDDGARPEEALQRLLKADLNAYVLAWLLRPPPDLLQAFERDVDTERVEGGKLDVLRATDRSEHVLRLLLDRTTHRPVMLRYWGRTRMGARALSRFVVGPTGPFGQSGHPEPADVESDLELRLSDFKADHGILLARRVLRRIRGQNVEELRVKQFMFNRVAADAFDRK